MPPAPRAADILGAAPAPLSDRQFDRIVKFFAAAMAASGADPQHAYTMLRQLDRLPGCLGSLRVQRLLAHAYRALAPQLSCPPSVSDRWLGGPLGAEDVDWPRLRCLQDMLSACLRAEHIYRHRRTDNGPQQAAGWARLRRESEVADLMLGLTIAELVSALMGYNPQLHTDLSPPQLVSLVHFNGQLAAQGRDVPAFWHSWQGCMQAHIESQGAFSEERLSRISAPADQGPQATLPVAEQLSR